MKRKFFSIKNFRLQTLFWILLLGTQTIFAQVQWRPVSQAELQQKTPLVEPDADAEAIFWEVRLDDEKRKKLFFNHYVRVKIFTERGREKFSKFDIPFIKNRKIEDVAARVIKPDGTIVSLQPGDIFERELFRAGKLSVRAKSFAVPGIEPGVIVEYQYKETVKGDSIHGERLLFQRDIPMQSVSYYVRPYKGEYLSFISKNMPEMTFDKVEDGFYRGTQRNVPSFKAEPQMPPDDEVKQWVLLSYNAAQRNTNWKVLGYGLSLFFAEITEVTKEIQQKANELTAGIDSDEEKLKKIFYFAQNDIRNISFDTSMTDEQRERLQNKKVTDTLTRRMGSSADIDFLFAALVKAAGFEASLMFSGDRSEIFFDPDKHNGLSYIHRSGIAVTLEHDMVYCSPGTPFLPFGMVDWYEEDVYTMFATDKSYRWGRIPLSNFKKNLSRRVGKFKLSEDGTLEGTIRVEHNGHQATTRRRDLFSRTVSEREEILKKSWQEIVSNGEFSAIAFENFNDSSKPYTYSLNVRVPNYAQKTGKRIFFQPNFFEYGSTPLFSSSSRKYDIYFEFPWAESDYIEIELPKGYKMDNPESPAPIADTGKITSLNVVMSVPEGTNTLKYNRQFIFGSNGRINFNVSAYQPIKSLFDGFHRADTFTVSLIQNQ